MSWLMLQCFNVSQNDAAVLRSTFVYIKHPRAIFVLPLNPHHVTIFHPQFENHLRVSVLIHDSLLRPRPSSSLSLSRRNTHHTHRIVPFLILNLPTNHPSKDSIFRNLEFRVQQKLATPNSIAHKTPESMHLLKSAILSNDLINPPPHDGKGDIK